MRLIRIVLAPLLLGGACSLLAACGGGESGYTPPPPSTAPKPFALTAYLITSPDTAVTRSLHASNIDNRPMTYEIGQKPAHGTASLDANSGILTYTPDQGYTGTDGLVYTAAAAGASSDKATVTILVNPDPPTVSAFGAPAYVHDGTPTSVSLDVRLSNPPNGQATVDYTTVNGTATAGTDYTTRSGTLTFGPGVLSQTITIPLTATVHRASRYFYLKLSNASSNLTMGRDVAAVVLRYYPEPLNDTGVTGCATATGFAPPNPDTCPQAGYPAQDGEIGRTAAASAGTLAQAGSGEFGYDFTALGYDGKPLFLQTLTRSGYSTQPWACLRDNWTGLVWEVPNRVAGAGLYDTSYLYSWYDPDSQSNGGDPGKANGSQRELDTYHFVQKVNAAKLCGYSDWRLPTAAELRNLINIGAPGVPNGDTQPLAAVPTLVPGGYWTATTGNLVSRAVVISTIYGYDSFLPKNSLYYVILVRGGVSP